MKVTKNFRFLFDLPETIHTAVLEGSTRSTKTYSIMQYLILWCVKNKDQTVRAFRQDGVTHNNTLIPDFMEIMIAEGLWHLGTWNKVEKTYYFPNGSQFAFAACKERDGSQKLHGLKQDIAWLNEVMEIAEDSYSQIAWRTKDLMIMDFNPSFNHHWVFDKVIKSPELVWSDDLKGLFAPKITRNKGVAYCHSTFEDNPFLSEAQKARIRQYNPDIPENVHNGTADLWKWSVYGLGVRGKVEGAIFKQFRLVDEMPPFLHCDKYGYGLDFGFSIDPMALIDCRFHNNEIWLEEKVYETDLLVTQNVSMPHRACLTNRMRDEEISKTNLIVADSAQPGSIEDLISSGYNVEGVAKVGDADHRSSIIRGLNIMKSFTINIMRNSINTQREVEHYKWGKKANGIGTGLPDTDCEDHAIDGSRYWSMYNLHNVNLVSHNTSSRKPRVKSRVKERVRQQSSRKKQPRR